MKLDLITATARPTEQPFTRPAMKTSGVGHVQNRCSTEPPAMLTMEHNVNELVLDLTTRVSHMNVSTNSIAPLSSDSPSTNSNAPLMSSESSSTNGNAPWMSSESSSTNGNAPLMSSESSSTNIHTRLTNCKGCVTLGDTSPTNENAERDTTNNVSEVSNSDIKDIEEKLSTLSFNIEADSVECQSEQDDVKDTVGEVKKEKVEDVEDERVNVAAKDLADDEGDTCDSKIKDEKDKDLKRVINVAVAKEEEDKPDETAVKRVIKVAVAEEEEKLIKVAVAEEEDKPDESARTAVKASSGGNLCPRSPMRPEFNLQRNEPYNQASRNAHHSGGRIVQVSKPDVTEPIASISLHQNTWLDTCNISPFQTVGDAYNSQPVLPFISCTSSPQRQANVDEGFFDFYTNYDELFLGDVGNAVNEATNVENIFGDGSPLPDLANHDGFSKILDELISTPDDVCASPTKTPVARDIPESVLALESDFQSHTSWRTEPMIPSVDSSGYHSSSSPRSTSTPSPTSLQESNDRYPGSPVDAEWHGTTSEQLYNNGDVLNSEIFGGFDSESGHTQATLQAEVFQTMMYLDDAMYDASGVLASGFVPVPEVFPWLQQDITQLPPNITQLQPDVTQQKCDTVGVGNTGPAGNRVLKRIQPKPSTTAKSATQRMLERMNKEQKKKIWAKISTISDEKIVEGDKDGDTQLMILLVQEPTNEQGEMCMLEFVYALVERLKRNKQNPEALASVNSQQESALYLAALHCSDKDSALITRYIAEAMFEVRANVDMVYKGGDSLLHCLCRDGANRYEVLKELLSLKDANRRLYFDINKYNDKGLTPLLEAVNSHVHAGSTKCIRLLLDAGADTALTVRDTPTTALHLAVATSCDPNLVDALLTDVHLSTVCSTNRYREASVLHLACGRNDVPADRQRHVVEALVACGARRDVRDGEGRLPCERLSAGRKEAFKS